MKNKILYRCYKDGKVIHRSWSMCVDDQGNKFNDDDYKRTIEYRISKDLMFFKSYIKDNIYDKIVCYLDGDFLKEVV